MCVLPVLAGIFHWLKSSCKVNLNISDSIYDLVGSSIFLLKFYHFLPQRNNQRQVLFFHIKCMLLFFKETDGKVITSLGKTCPGKVHISLYFTFFFFFLFPLVYLIIMICVFTWYLDLLWKNVRIVFWSYNTMTVLSIFSNSPSVFLQGSCSVLQLSKN